MAFPDPPPVIPTKPPKIKGFHLPSREPYARATERRNHEEALNTFGEYDLFVLMWALIDHDEGRVTRCSRCAAIGSRDVPNSALVFATYNTPVEDRCVNCYGTTFEGGWKAKLIRPGMWAHNEEDTTTQARGQVIKHFGSVQSTSDFFLRDGDYVFRADGTRWQINESQATRIVDGFGIPTRADSNLGVNYSSAIREDPSSVAYIIPPTTRTELTTLLNSIGKHFPSDYTAFDQIRGPILPETNEFHPVDYRLVDDLPGPPGAPL